MTYRKRAYRNDGRMSDTRIAWAKTLIGNVDIHQYAPNPEEFDEKGEQIGPNLMVGFVQTGTTRMYRMMLTALTVEELSAMRELFDLAFDLAEPVVKERDEVARRAHAAGDDSFGRNYRRLPEKVVRDGKILTYPEGVHDGPQDVPAGPGRVADSEGGHGGAGRAGDGVAYEEPEDLGA